VLTAIKCFSYAFITGYSHIHLG